MDGILTLIILYIIAKIIIAVLNKFVKRTSLGHEKAFATTTQIIKNIVRVVFVIMGLFTILEIFGVNTASLIATAGIGGVAIGFGAQSLVKDVISGFFILAEGQYYIGDEVVIEGVSGNITEFNLRTTKIKDFETGAIHIIPNGNIKKVENRSKVDQVARIFIDIPTDQDPEKVLGILETELEKLKDQRFITGPEVRGISGFKERYYTVFIHSTVENGAIYAMQRTLRRYVTEALLEHDISLYRPVVGIEEVK